MHSHDLIAQTTSIAVATVAMFAAWLATRRCPHPAPVPDAEPGPDAERPT